MKNLLLIFLIVSIDVYSQQIKEYEPIRIGVEFDFTDEFAAKYNTNEAFEECSKIYTKIRTDGRDLDEATKEELEILKYCNEVKSSIWDSVGDACSWYCGGGPSKVTASSYLNSQGNNNYHPKNAHDLNYKYAWVEGSEGYGIGEFLVYEFASESPRITDIIIANGYVKSENAWKSNSRVKKLKVYYNDQPFAILYLKDVRAEQTFKFSPIGNDPGKIKEPWNLKFEILDVYKGTKYSDTVISELYFAGIDVH
ncbi:MAG: NADase-type glycan-binding domain-containing protein [Candidatus Cyclobacteriaceae bacterium M2_1C_046]